MKGIRAHYVPQFYLKNFGAQIYQYDKQTSKVSKSTPRKVAAERDFYVDFNDDIASKLEKAMSEIEGNASGVINNIIRNESITGLSVADMAHLCGFVALQVVRTPEHREWRGDMAQSAFDAITKNMGVTDYRIMEKNPKLSHLATIPDSMDAIGQQLFRMQVCLTKNNTPIPLWTSDNPVVRHNDITGKLGAGSPGVQFYFPLTPKILLTLYDNTHIDILGDALIDSVISREKWAWARSNILETACMEKEHVIFANHIQARFSARFIFSNWRRFPMMGAYRKADGDYKRRHVFQEPNLDEIGHQDNKAIRGNGWECQDSSTSSGADALNSNLQNALHWYRKSKREPDLRKTFMHLCLSLEMLTGHTWDMDLLGDGFDDRVRELTGEPALSLDRFRQIHDGMRRNGGSDPHVDEVQMAKDVKDLRRIAGKAISRYILNPL